MCTATRYNGAILIMLLIYILPIFASIDHEILCGKDVNSHINGELPISATAFLVDKTSTFTSIIVSSVLTATIAFVGTANGMVHKVLVGGNGESRIIKSMQLTPDETPILRDMALDDKNGLLYAMSKFAVYKINVKLCSHSQDCHSCLMTSDPYCGWCMSKSIYSSMLDF
jgi:hypothetical protein